MRGPVVAADDVVVASEHEAVVVFDRQGPDCLQEGRDELLSAVGLGGDPVTARRAVTGSPIAGAGVCTMTHPARCAVVGEADISRKLAVADRCPVTVAACLELCALHGATNRPHHKGGTRT
ncbi:hypothetical protein GCM10022416_45510 [Actinomadura keratinilytica]|uniref:Uncharacterized protein n=1 Tax=Actinomadura keratinilytica TaxID=547461 RepID=A0ABP7Z8D1_9ACTN